MLHILKPYVERYPALARTYREARDQWARRNRKPRKTALGFDFVGDESVAEGNFEEEETTLIQELVDGIDVFVDVGAHAGFYTCLVGSRGKHTVSVEPLADNLGLLYQNLLLNRLESAEVWPVGLASEPGIRTLFGAATGASLVSGWAGSSAQYARTIPVTTLDNLLRGRFEGRRLFVKMDIEGGELDAIRGATETLTRTPRPAWLLEICLTENQPSGTNPRFRDVFDIFWSYGYEAHTPDAARRVVAPADVTRWVAQGKRDFGTYNFLFTVPTGSGATTR